MRYGQSGAGFPDHPARIDRSRLLRVHRRESERHGRRIAVQRVWGGRRRRSRRDLERSRVVDTRPAEKKPVSTGVSVDRTRNRLSRFVALVDEHRLVTGLRPMEMTGALFAFVTSAFFGDGNEYSGRIHLVELVNHE